MRILIIAMLALTSFAAKADYWMTMATTPGKDGKTYCQVGYVKPDAEGFVTIKCGTSGLEVVVYKTQVWYQKMPGEAPKGL